MCWLVTESKRRRRKWEKIFGEERVPVQYARPVLAYGREHEPVYVLDVSRLLPIQQRRVALHMAKQTRRPVDQVLNELREGIEVVTFDPKQTRLVTE